MNGKTLKGLKTRYEFLQELKEKIAGNEIELKEMISKSIKDTKELIKNECERSN